MPKKIHEVNMHAKDFQEPTPKRNTKRRKDTKRINHHLEDIIKDTSRNEISIDIRKRKDIELPKERMVLNRPSPLQSFMMAQSTKTKRFVFHQHTLDKDHKESVLKKIG
jgi:hypothetical protein